MFKFIGLRGLFEKPKADVIIHKTIEQYKRELLVVEAHAAYNSKMADFYKEGIVRLKKKVERSE